MNRILNVIDVLLQELEATPVRPPMTPGAGQGSAHRHAFKKINRKKSAVAKLCNLYRAPTARGGSETHADGNPSCSDSWSETPTGTRRHTCG